VDKLVHVFVFGLVAIRRDASFARTVDKLGKPDGTLLIFPNQDLRKGDEEESKHHQCDALRLISLVDRLEVSWHVHSLACLRLGEHLALGGGIGGEFLGAQISAIRDAQEKGNRCR